MNPVRAQKALAVCAARGLARLEEGDVTALAAALWHEGFEPDVAALEKSYRADVGYLLDLLTRLGPLSREQKEQLRRPLESLRPTAPKETRSRDPLAKAWGASCDLTRFLPQVLKLQRRAYQHVPA